jgi:hypothetical protein
MFGDQHQGLDRCTQCQRVMLALRQARDVVRGIAQGARLI